MSESNTTSDAPSSPSSSSSVASPTIAPVAVSVPSSFAPVNGPPLCSQTIDGDESNSRPSQTTEGQPITPSPFQGSGNPTKPETPSSSAGVPPSLEKLSLEDPPPPISVSKRADAPYPDRWATNETRGGKPFEIFADIVRKRNPSPYKSSTSPFQGATDVLVEFFMDTDDAKEMLRCVDFVMDPKFKTEGMHSILDEVESDEQSDSVVGALGLPTMFERLHFFANPASKDEVALWAVSIPEKVHRTTFVDDWEAAHAEHFPNCKILRRVWEDRSVILPALEYSWDSAKNLVAAKLRREAIITPDKPRVAICVKAILPPPEDGVAPVGRTVRDVFGEKFWVWRVDGSAQYSGGDSADLFVSEPLACDDVEDDADGALGPRSADSVVVWVCLANPGL